MSSEEHNEPEIIFEKQNRAGVITLNRPRALNALSHDMIRALEEHYHLWAKDADIYGIVMRSTSDRAFCAGADIRESYALGRAGDPEAITFYRDEYQHNWTLECFIKPNIALIDGILMGGGVGASLYGTHRVAGENMSFAMPETGIGLFPDVGASYFLPRFPGRLGLYLGLTGNSVGRADAYHLGVVTHCISAEHFDDILAAMREAEPIDPVLDALHRDPGEGELARLQPVIDRIFGAGSVEEILVLLDAEEGDAQAWARETAKTLRRRSPTSLKIAFRAYHEGARLSSLKDNLAMEFRLAVRCLRGHDFYEGVRAQVIDKDRNPNWEPARLEEVSDAAIHACFAPLEDVEELQLQDYWTLVE